MSNSYLRIKKNNDDDIILSNDLNIGVINNNSYKVILDFNDTILNVKFRTVHGDYSRGIVLNDLPYSNITINPVYYIPDKQYSLRVFNLTDVNRYILDLIN
jgi:hypothetical protein